MSAVEIMGADPMSEPEVLHGPRLLLAERSNETEGWCGEQAPAKPGASPIVLTPGMDQSAERTGDTDTATGWLVLRFWAQQFHDMQDNRKAFRSRALAYQNMLDAKAGDEIGSTFDLLETQVKRALRGTFRAVVPAEIKAWQASTPAIGEHALARLLGAIGDPAIAWPHHWEGSGPDRTLVADAPYWRTFAQLRSYCGHGDKTRRPRTKNISAEALASCGSPAAKMILHLMAEDAVKAKGCEYTVKSGKTVVKQASPYRAVYDEARAKYAEREGWTDLHRHNAALTKVGCAILADLWAAARSAHGLGADRNCEPEARCGPHLPPPTMYQTVPISTTSGATSDGR